MAGHIQDRWYKTETDADGKTAASRPTATAPACATAPATSAPTAPRSRSRFPTDRSASPRRGSRDRGRHDARAVHRPVGRQGYVPAVRREVARAQTTDPTTASERGAAPSAARLPDIGSRPLGLFQPEHIRELAARPGRRAGSAPPTPRHLRQRLAPCSSAAVDDGISAPEPLPAHAPSAGARARRSRVVPWRPSGCSPSGRRCPSATEPWSTSAPDAACDRARSSAWPSTPSTSTATASRGPAGQADRGARRCSLRPRAARSGTCRCPTSVADALAAAHRRRSRPWRSRCRGRRRTGRR